VATVSLHSKNQNFAYPKHPQQNPQKVRPEVFFWRQPQQQLASVSSSNMQQQHSEDGI
jgi:hypothetical protein